MNGARIGGMTGVIMTTPRERIRSILKAPPTVSDAAGAGATATPGAADESMIAPAKLK